MIFAHAGTDEISSLLDVERQPTPMPFTQPGESASAIFGTYNDINIHNSVLPTDLAALLNPVHAAAYDCGPRADSTCFEGTRVQIVEEISHWAENPSDHRICLLYGPAGFGKSAIARTVARRWDRVHRLAGSFCFFRNSGEQSKAARLIPTLAFQISISIPGTKAAIEKALRDDPSLFHRTVEHQFQKLIVDPIAALPIQSQTGMLIMVDGLDECDDSHSISRLVQAIVSANVSQLPILFLFTSRIEEHIHIIFRGSTTSAITRELSLSDFDAHDDIQLFLTAQFESIYHDHRRLMKGTPLPWPSPSELSHIVRLMNGSFIFASTLAKYVRDGTPPPTRLTPIVETNTGVDGMYRDILSQFWNDIRFQIVFSTIILLKFPLSVASLGRLLQLSDRNILSEILKIQSILIVPDNDEVEVAIVHTSLRDFSMSSERSQDLCVDTAERHLRLCIYCLQVMSTSTPTLGGVIFDTEAVKYACHYWLGYLRLALQSPRSRSMRYDSLMESLTSFTTNAFDIWLNTVVCYDLVGGDEDPTVSLEAIVQKAKEIPGFPHEAVRILKRIRELLKSVSAVQLLFNL